jgi:hypothetical protein
VHERRGCRIEKLLPQLMTDLWLVLGGNSDVAASYVGPSLSPRNQVP